MTAFAERRIDENTPCLIVRLLPAQGGGEYFGVEKEL